jgi:hypothetical protein
MPFFLSSSSLFVNMLTKGEKDDWDVPLPRVLAFVSWEKLLLLPCFNSINWTHFIWFVICVWYSISWLPLLATWIWLWTCRGFLKL